MTIPTPAARTPETAADAAKRPYARPVLRTYGDLRQLTLAKGRHGANADGALANNNKTI
jgi:hypothetical protein